MGKFIQDFKEFALKGNVIDMAVGVIVGGAFGKIVSSLVNDIIMPEPTVRSPWRRWRSTTASSSRT